MTSCSPPPSTVKPYIPESSNGNPQPGEQHTRSKQLLVVLAFSGGGSRAAALSFGVLRKLRNTRIHINGEQRRLLDEIDYISSVSGGSFTSAYYGLFGDQVFDRFEQDFLKKDIQSILVHRILSPWNWPGLWTDADNRSKLAARLYDEVLFHGRTFSDLNQSRTPFIQISATNLTSGIPFTFDQHQFSQLCQDLSTFSIARAVAASAAVPLALSPISLLNQSHTCANPLQPWAEQAVKICVLRTQTCLLPPIRGL